MSLGLQATKRRIVSVNSTKKITKAMQLVATAKLKSMKNSQISSSYYADEVSFLTASLLNRMTDEEKSQIIITPEETSESVLYIVISSSLGLCGGYNYNLFKEVSPLIDKEKDMVLTIGQKALSYYKNRRYLVDDSYVDALNTFNDESVDKIVKYALYLYSSGKCKKIVLCYTHYKNQITFIPKTHTLYPLEDMITSERKLTRKEEDMIVEPNSLAIMQILFPLYLKTVLRSKMNESILSEYASRRNAMENATNNAEEIVSELQIEYNKARQAAITQEITEVVGGANASK